MKFKKKVILKALTDAKFRKLLQENPEAALSIDEFKNVKAGQIINPTEILSIVNQTYANAQKISDVIFCIPPDTFDPVA